MTVMPSSSDVADKAVSTEDASSGVEVARLEAVLAALVESKVEAMKAEASRRSNSEPVSPRPRPRLASSSTLSSSHHHHHHSHHSHHSRHHHSHHHEKRHKQQRRHGSAPCARDYAQRQAAKQPHNRAREQSEAARQAELFDPDSPGGLTEPIGHDSFDYPRLHQSACYMSHSAAHLRSQLDEDEYLSFGYMDEVCGAEDETLSGPPSLGGPAEAHYRQRAERFHRPRRKKRRRRKAGRQPRLVDLEAGDLELGLAVVDPDDLPPRARWTIVATACLLLAMSLLLVGVTLRMAPIIDEMVRKENEELLNSLNREPTNLTTSPLPT